MSDDCANVEYALTATSIPKIASQNAVDDIFLMIKLRMNVLRYLVPQTVTRSLRKKCFK